MSDAEGADELASSLQASIRLFIAAGRKARPQGEVSGPEIAALMRIKHAGETTSGVLARLEGISPQAMGVTIAALEARGLIKREKDADDARRILLRLTDAGSELMTARRDARASAMARVLEAQFNAEELATLRAAAPLLSRLAEDL